MFVRIKTARDAASGRRRPDGAVSVTTQLCVNSDYTGVSDIDGLLRRSSSSTDTVGNANSRIGVSGQIHPRVFLQHVRDPLNMVLMPHRVLGHRRRPARDE